MREFLFLFLLLSFLKCSVVKEKKGLISKDTQTKNLSLGGIDDDSLIICHFPMEPDIDFGKWQKYLQDNLILDSVSLDTIPAGKYITIIEFTIDENGKIIKASIQKDPGYGLGERARKVILSYESKCFISQTYMETHKSYRLQPITFLIEDEECKESMRPNLIL